jgi:hypothetical protein
METTLLFTRNQSGDIETFAVVTFKCAETSVPSLLIEKFKRAVTSWMKTTSIGDKAWTYSCSSFNIGDYASYLNDEALVRCLSDEGLSVDIALMNDVDSVIPYDLTLANSDEIDGE